MMGNLLGTALSVLFATLIFSSCWKFFADKLGDPKYVLILFSFSLTTGWVLMKCFTFAVKRGDKG